MTLASNKVKISKSNVLIMSTKTSHAAGSLLEMQMTIDEFSSVQPQKIPRKQYRLIANVKLKLYVSGSVWKVHIAAPKQ